MEIYHEIARNAPNPAGWFSIVRYLSRCLPAMWADEYAAMTTSPSDLLTVTFKDKEHPNHFVSTMFDYASGAAGSNRTLTGTEDRVVAVWGLSRSEPANSRDKSRMAGYLRGIWSDAYPGDDRGHFFAHTMGGGVDINLFPQLASRNRGGKWRELEIEAAANPGTFCFIRPLYNGSGWRPSGLEYGLFSMPPNAFKFKGALFAN